MNCCENHASELRCDYCPWCKLRAVEAEVERLEKEVAEACELLDYYRPLEAQLEIYRDGIFQLNNAAAEKPLSQDYIVGVTSMIIEKAGE